MQSFTGSRSTRLPVLRSGLLSGILLLILFGAPCTATAQYSTNLSDINTNAYWRLRFAPINTSATSLPTPIGDLGDVETVIDLRGFVPMPLASRSKFWSTTLVDNLAWFEIPLRKALLMLYYGDIRLDQINSDTAAMENQRFASTRFTGEAVGRGEEAAWSKFAFDLAAQSGPMFQAIAGSGFQSGEPVAVLLTRQSAFVLLSLKYSSPLVSQGQVLVAVELSRTSHRLRTTYQLYSTLLANKSRADLAAAVAPYAARALIAYFGGDGGQ
jgi:hypothetical protein